MLQKFGQYIDTETGVVKRPEAWNDLFGDGVWRSSWFYASLLIIQKEDDNTYKRLQTEHKVDASMAGKFLKYFRDHSISDHDWKLPKNDSQKFSRDQLVPLLYLLAAVAKYAPEYKDIGRDILKSLGKLEEHGRGVSDSANGSIGRNIGYMVDVLSDSNRYDIIYRTNDMNVWRVTAGFNEKKAKENRRTAYKEAFSLALKAHKISGDWEQISGLEASDSYSVFNALGATSLQCIAWGKNNGDVTEWRSNFKVHADAGWGPAFKLVVNRKVNDAEIEEYYTAHVTSDQDNDIIMAQRPRKIRDGILHPLQKGGDGQWLVIDYVVLKALDLLWK